MDKVFLFTAVDLWLNERFVGNTESFGRDSAVLFLMAGERQVSVEQSEQQGAPERHTWFREEAARFNRALHLIYEAETNHNAAGVLGGNERPPLTSAEFELN